jgi:hypothetical protein
MDGPEEVLQQTPWAIIGAPPLLVMFPPLMAVVDVRDVIEFVEKAGNEGAIVIKLISFP